MDNRADLPLEVQELAQAIRAGLEHRLSAPPVPFAATPTPFSSQTRNALQSYADLVHLPPLAKPGRLARFVRLARRTLKSLLRPWLAGQTEFNQLVIQVLETMNQELS